MKEKERAIVFLNAERSFLEERIKEVFEMDFDSMSLTRVSALSRTIDIMSYLLLRIMDRLEDQNGYDDSFWAYMEETFFQKGEREFKKKLYEEITRSVSSYLK